MDRISALRNVEDALRKFERGDADLLATEREVATVLRTYATEFESDEGLAAYRATGLDRAGDAGRTGTGRDGDDGDDGDGPTAAGEDGRAPGTTSDTAEPVEAGSDAAGTDAAGAGGGTTVVVAASRAEARERLASLFDLPIDAAFDVERLA